MNTNPMFYTLGGRPTRYALACGYVESNDRARLSIPSPSAGLILVTTANGASLYHGRKIKDARAAFDSATRHGATLRIFDNGGKTLDRYTIMPPRWATSYRGNGADNWGASWGWACIVSGVDPRGISGHETATPGPHLGRRIAWADLPDAVQAFARSTFPEFTP